MWLNNIFLIKNLMISIYNYINDYVFNKRGLRFEYAWLINKQNNLFPIYNGNLII